MALDPNHFVDLVDGRFTQTSARDLANLFANARDQNHLVVHFHGGLVSRDSAVDSALQLVGTYQAGGAYPVFFIWNSDLPSVVKGHWDEIPRERAFIQLVRRLIQLAIGKLSKDGGGGGRTIQPPPLSEVPPKLSDVASYAKDHETKLNRDAGELTPDQEAQVEQELDMDPVIREASAQIALYEQQAQGRELTAAHGATTPAGPPTPTLMSAEVREDIRNDFFATPGQPARRGAWLLTLARHGAAILANVIRRYIGHRDHGLYTTVVEETMRRVYVDSLGQVAWELMKKDTVHAFDPDASLHGGTAFLQHLACWWKDDRRVTLVGHSTGAIYICNLLEASDAVLRREIGFDVIFLAPACTFEFMRSCLPVFRGRVGDHIRSFGLHDAREHGYFEVPILYEGSLLYMVSGLFEKTEVDKPIVGMERFYRSNNPFNDPAVLDVRAYLEGKHVWSACPSPEGWRSDATRHGRFAADQWTKGSLGYLVQSGIR